MAVVSKTGTLTGSGTVDTITLTFPTAATVSWVSVTVLGLSGTTQVSFSLATNGGTAQTEVAAVGDANVYHLNVVNPTLSVEVGVCTALVVKMVAASALTYTIIAQ